MPAPCANEQRHRHLHRGWIYRSVASRRPDEQRSDGEDPRVVCSDTLVPRGAHRSRSTCVICARSLGDRESVLAPSLRGLLRGVSRLQQISVR